MTSCPSGSLLGELVERAVAGESPRVAEAVDPFLVGFWRGGDIGTIDPDGYLNFTD